MLPDAEPRKQQQVVRGNLAGCGGLNHPPAIKLRSPARSVPYPSIRRATSSVPIPFPHPRKELRGTRENRQPYRAAGSPIAKVINRSSSARVPVNLIDPGFAVTFRSPPPPSPIGPLCDLESARSLRGDI
ncbi:hypothetical protein PVAP13_6NG106503 [Panicum virgatum]|uniref:Uncharacterized protein n=1 Tax=Panicum virgatum TaxID=38727 RepID=A0A8T0QWC7_PANVG|nr:hypothetical protein PVAP13_6NG106503 [Panicum virgatum]